VRRRGSWADEGVRLEEVWRGMEVVGGFLSPTLVLLSYLETPMLDFPSTPFLLCMLPTCSKILKVLLKAHCPAEGIFSSI